MKSLYLTSCNLNHDISNPHVWESMNHYCTDTGYCQTGYLVPVKHPWLWSLSHLWKFHPKGKNEDCLIKEKMCLKGNNARIDLLKQESYPIKTCLNAGFSLSFLLQYQYLLWAVTRCPWILTHQLKVIVINVVNINSSKGRKSRQRSCLVDDKRPSVIKRGLLDHCQA